MKKITGSNRQDVTKVVTASGVTGYRAKSIATLRAKIAQPCSEDRSVRPIIDPDRLHQQRFAPDRQLARGSYAWLLTPPAQPIACPKVDVGVQIGLPCSRSRAGSGLLRNSRIRDWRQWTTSLGY